MDNIIYDVDNSVEVPFHRVVFQKVLVLLVVRGIIEIVVFLDALVCVLLVIGLVSVVVLKDADFYGWKKSKI